MVTMSDYVGLKPAWCPGCGNFGILRSLNRALVELNMEPHQILLVSGIGQAGKFPHYTKGNIFNSLHGRPIPAAAGAKIANPALKVIAVSGDGDAYGEGGNHFMHACRRNHDITYLIHDNQVYALTKGQTSPTSDPGYVTATTPAGATVAVNPIMLALAAGATFVARGFAGDIEHLSGVIKQGILHRGFAVIDILQPCPTFNHRNTFAWYQQRVYRIENDASYDPSDKGQALQKAQEWGERIPIGLLYRTTAPTYEDQLAVLKRGPLVTREADPRVVEPLFESFM